MYYSELPAPCVNELPAIKATKSFFAQKVDDDDN